MSIPEMIIWATENPQQALASVMTVLGAVALVARAIVKYAAQFGFSPAPGTFWHSFLELCKFLGTVIPNNPNDPAIKQAAEKAADKAVIKVAAASSGLDQIEGANGEDSMMGSSRLFGGRRLMRLHVRRQAKRHDLDISEWDDEQVDEVLDRAQLKANELSGGPIRDLFDWIIAHPEEVLAIIKFLMTIFAAAPKAKAVRK